MCLRGVDGTLDTLKRTEQVRVDNTFVGLVFYEDKA